MRKTIAMDQAAHRKTLATPFVPIRAEQDRTVLSDPFLPFLKSLDDDVQLHRERADALKEAYDKHISEGDSASKCSSTWERYTAQCDCFASAIERREKAWERRERDKTEKRWARIRASFLLVMLCIAVLCWFLGARSLVIWAAIVASPWIIGAGFGWFVSRFVNLFSDAIAEKVIERQRSRFHHSSN